MVSPLPRYLWSRGCTDVSHITTSEQPGYAMGMERALRELHARIKTMIIMRKMKDVCVLNPIEALGIIPSSDRDEEEDADRIMNLWRPDPVHPTTAAYEALAGQLTEKVTGVLTKLQDQEHNSSNIKRKAEPRDPWMEQSQSIAKRVEHTRGDYYPQRGGRGRGGGPVPLA